MFLSEIFEQLTTGELSQVFVGNSEGIGIEPCDYSKIIPHINLGLLELYKRFPIRIDEVIIQQYDQIETYYLRKQFAKTNTQSTEPIKYIIDSEFEPFKQNVLLIEKVFNEDGQELFLNQPNEYWSVHTPVYDAIQIPYTEKENALAVQYRAAPDKIELANLDPSTLDIALPLPMLEPLLLYVASRVFASTGLTDNINESNNYLAKFEAGIKRIEDLRLVNENDTYNNRLDKNGWV